jgi:hypothetical protein
VQLSSCDCPTDISSRLCSPLHQASPINMSRAYVTPNSDLEARIAQLDEGARRIMRFHSGSREEDRASLLDALEDHYRQTPCVPVIHIHRRPPSKGREGAMDSVRCGLCLQSGKFQKVASHIVNDHFKLVLWYCGVGLW